MTGKTPQYTKDAINKYNAKFDRVAVNLPKGTKERIKELTCMSCNAYISELVLKDLEQREKQDAKLVEVIQEDVKQIAKNIDDEIIAAGIPELDSAKKAEIKAKLDAKIAEYEAKKAEKEKENKTPKKGSLEEKLEQLKKDNSEGKLRIKDNEDI